MQTNSPLIIRFHAQDPSQLPDVRPREVSDVVAGLEGLTEAVARAAGTHVTPRFVYAAAPRAGCLEILIAAKVELDVIATPNDVSSLLDIAESGSAIAANLLLLVFTVLQLRAGAQNPIGAASPTLAEVAQRVEMDREVRRSIHELHQKARPQTAVSIDISFGDVPVVQIFPSTLPAPASKVLAAAKNPLSGPIKVLGEPWGKPIDITYLGRPVKAVTATAAVTNDKKPARDVSTIRKKCLAIWQSKMPIPEKGTRTVEARVLGQAEAMDIVMSDANAEGLDFNHVIEVLRVENVEWG